MKDGTRDVTAHVLERLRILIYLSNRTQREVEIKVGFSRGYLSQLLAGTVEMKYWQLLEILRALEIEPSEFFAEIFPRRRALATLDHILERVRQKPLSYELARLYAFGIESVADFCERLERCEDALEELNDLGFLES